MLLNIFINDTKCLINFIFHDEKLYWMMWIFVDKNEPLKIQTNRYASYVYYHSITIHWSYSLNILSTYSLHMSKHFHARINPSFTIVKFILLDMLKKEYMYTSIIIVYTAVFEVSVFIKYMLCMMEGNLDLIWCVGFNWN